MSWLSYLEITYTTDSIKYISQLVTDIKNMTNKWFSVRRISQCSPLKAIRREISRSICICEHRTTIDQVRIILKKRLHCCVAQNKKNDYEWRDRSCILKTWVVEVWEWERRKDYGWFSLTLRLLMEEWRPCQERTRHARILLSWLWFWWRLRYGEHDTIVKKKNVMRTMQYVNWECRDLRWKRHYRLFAVWLIIKTWYKDTVTEKKDERLSSIKIRRSGRWFVFFSEKLTSEGYRDRSMIQLMKTYIKKEKYVIDDGLRQHRRES